MAAKMNEELIYEILSAVEEIPEGLLETGRRELEPGRIIR